jgi:hypothetical protein
MGMNMLSKMRFAKGEGLENHKKGIKTSVEVVFQSGLVM